MISLVENSPKTYARVGGVLYLIIAAGLFDEAFGQERLWLTVKEVNVSKWKELSSMSA